MLTATLLKILLKLKYIRGSFSNVQTESDDPEWSVNIKRGLLSLGVINFEERRSLDPVSRMLNTGRLPQDQTEIYSVMEPSIGGECETVYNVRPLLDSSSGEPRMFVTKTRNYMKCLNRASFTNNIYHGHTCAECEKDRTEPVKSGSQIHYVILGNKREYLVESIIAESQHVFTPYSEKGGNVATYINQTLILTGVKEQQERVSLRSPKRQPSDLLAQLPGQRKQQQQQESSQEQESSSQEQPERRRQLVSRDQQQSSQQRRRQQRRRQRQEQQEQQQSQEEQQRSLQKIDKLLHTLSTFTDVTIQEEAGPFVLTLLEEYQKADDIVLRQLFQKYCSERNPSNPQIRRIRKIFLDMLPFIGTFVSGDILSEAISNNKITPEEAMSYFSILTFASKPDIRLAQKLLIF
ncbi:hypothetical protein KUTeg_016755 [Tegillarca granosa]|uniref:Vitellogenin domain-containing protein n=1 Tax=Tegillarca granosa TaxID=220873 RepID=A0ABQ9ES49_TEGGR|nr:hypothetical protein KUTeg_016755 [Tegillarca granosa]